MRRVLQRDSTAAVLSWSIVALVLAVSLWAGVDGTIDRALLGVGLLGVLLVPPIVHRDPGTMLPWPMALLAGVPFTVNAITGSGTIAELAGYLTAAGIALLIVVELDVYTPVKMNRGFAVVFVIATTMTVAGVWELLRWGWDLAFGTELVESNDAVMRQLIAATGVGVLVGAVFNTYLREYLGLERLPDGIEPDDAEKQVDDAGEAVSSVLSKVGLSTDDERRLTRLLQGVLAGILLVGLVTLNADVVVSATIGLVATLLPGLFERSYDFQIDPALTLWIAVAVVFHALGTLWFYQTLWGWHNIAHATTGSLVAGVGYTVLRTIETHTVSVSFPPKFTLVFVVISVFAVGVAWEILEFTLDQVTVAVLGEEMFLTQHGLLDTMSDLVANTVGALIVAIAATVYRTRSSR